MAKNQGAVEIVCEVAVGGEATVYLELRSRFQGIGGTVITQEGVASALRAENSPGTKAGHKMFLKHAIIKKLEDYFHRTEKYLFSHVPRPLGSISRTEGERYEAYMYEWAFGTEGFPWVYMDDDGNKAFVKLHDWDRFLATFHAAGVDMTVDIADPDDADISKNVIHQFPEPAGSAPEMNRLWKRIDFGDQSVHIDFQALEKFLHDERDSLIAVLRYWRYEMLELAKEYLAGRETMRERDIGRLETLVADYRRSSLHHLVSRGVGLTEAAAPYIAGVDETTESLL